jgi:hypothetical protein
MKVILLVTLRLVCPAVFELISAQAENVGLTKLRDISAKVRSTRISGHSRYGDEVAAPLVPLVFGSGG